VSRQEIPPDEYLEKMRDFIKNNGIPLTGKTPTVSVQKGGGGIGAELCCDKRDEANVRDAFKAVGHTYTAQPQFFPDWKLL